jgi:hypothetical protein
MFVTQATSQNWKEEEEEEEEEVTVIYFEFRQIWQNIFMDDCHLSKQHDKIGLEKINLTFIF